jgi:hypothetical protein
LEPYSSIEKRNMTRDIIAMMIEFTNNPTNKTGEIDKKVEAA